MNLFQKYLVEEFAEDYQEGHISRRQALKMIAGVTGSLIIANSILASCAAPPQAESTAVLSAAGPTDMPAATPTQAPAASTTQPAERPSQTPASTEETPSNAADQPVEGQEVQFSADEATLLGYLALPGGDEKHPVVLVCHENRGLTEHIKDVTRRLGSAGYIALAVDLLSRQGGTAMLSSDDVPGELGNTSPDQFVADFRSGWSYLQGLPNADVQRVGMVGFCFGGGVTWLMATRMPELRAAVPFYGPHPAVENVPDIQAAVLAIYAGNDQRINQGIPAIEEAMLQNNKIYEKVIYPGVDHAFHNDTGSRYNPEAAADAWKRTLNWFAKYL